MNAHLIAALAAAGLVAATSAAHAQASIGERLAKSACAQCHTFGKGEPPGAGPNLYGLIGRPAGAAAGFDYSAPFLAALKGKTWDPSLIERWLTDTQQVAPGSGMIYFQDDPQKREELIKYLASLK